MLQVHGARLDHHADHREHHRQLVGNQLARRAQAAEQRVLVRARPAGDEDAEHGHRRHRECVEHAGLEVGEPRIGTEGHHRDEQEGARQHHERRELEEELVRPLGVDVLLLQPLADLGEELQRPVRAGLHRAETALHERHHLEQEQVDHRSRGKEHGDETADDAEERLGPVRHVGGEQRTHQRSMSPRMKYSDARIVMMSGTYTPFSTHGTIEMLLNDALRIFTRNGPSSLRDTT
jgi:hypothetical protein